MSVLIRLKYPNTLAGLSSWYKADDFRESAEGSVISEWKDHSSYKKNAVQATAGRMPLVRLNQQNGLPVVEFDGVNNVLVAPHHAGLDFTSNYTVIILRKQTDMTGYSVSLSKGSNPWQVNSWYIESPYFITSVPGTAYTLTEPVNNKGFWRLSTFIVDSTNTGIGYSNTVAGNPQLNLLMTANSSPLLIGAYNETSPSANGNAFQGQIAEIIIYKRALSSVERMQVESYLKYKWKV